MWKCSHCGKEFVLRDGKIPTHDFPVPCRAVCNGSGLEPAEIIGSYGIKIDGIKPYFVSKDKP